MFQKIHAVFLFFHVLDEVKHTHTKNCLKIYFIEMTATRMLLLQSVLSHRD
jgi:hypothetical protein